MLAKIRQIIRLNPPKGPKPKIGRKGGGHKNESYDLLAPLEVVEISLFVSKDSSCDLSKLALKKPGRS